MFAQQEKPVAPYTFVGVQGGMQNTYNTQFAFGRTWSPSAALSVGHFFSRDLGLRVNFNGSRAKGNAPFLSAPTKQFKYNQFTTSADVMVNAASIFAPYAKKYTPVNFYVIGGFGFNYDWDNDDALSLYKQGADLPYADQDNKRGMNLRLGGQLEFNICKAVAFNLEATYNYMTNQRKQKFVEDRSQLELLAGFNFKFAYKKKKVKEEAHVVEEVVPEPVYATRIDTIWYDDLEYVDATRDRDIKREIFYGLAKSDVSSNQSQILEVAEFLKGVKDAEITITGYADKGTGSEAKNMYYSKMRAEQTKTALIEAGVDKNVIKLVEWKGDTVQPYAENDKNRLAIITGHGIYSAKESHKEKKFRLVTVRYRVQ